MLCPACGSGHAHSNLADEGPFVLAAQCARELRYFGEIETAREVLKRLSDIRIENFLALRWQCECGVCYDA